jgi:heme exporter protein C
MTSQPTTLKFLTLLSLILFALATLLDFTYPDTERTLGEVQRLFYIHLGSFYGAFLVFGLAVIVGIVYLRTRQPFWDYLGLASMEIGVGFSAITIVTGMFVARPVWGVYWIWDPRLTSVAIMWLTYASYFFLRNGIEAVDLRRRFAAIYGILAFFSVIATMGILRFRADTIYPLASSPAEFLSSPSLSPRIQQTILVNIAAYGLLAVVLVWHRLRLEIHKEALQAQRLELLGK